MASVISRVPVVLEPAAKAWFKSSILKESNIGSVFRHLLSVECMLETVRIMSAHLATTQITCCPVQLRTLW